MASYNNPSSFLDGLGLRPEEIDAPTPAEREELINIIESIEVLNCVAVADAILAAGWRKQKP